MNFLRRLALQERKKNLMAALISLLLKSRASLTRFRACFLPGRAKDLSAPRYVLLGKGKLHPGCFTLDYEALAALVNVPVALTMYLISVASAVHCGQFPCVPGNKIWSLVRSTRNVMLEWGKEMTLDSIK